MTEIKRLPESEQEVMLALWQLQSPATADRIMEKLCKSWGKTTLLSLLTRLQNRGFLTCRKEGRVNVYTPVISREEYVQRESGSFLRRVHAGSLTGLVASLYEGRSITGEDLEELRKFLDEAR